YRQQHVDRSIGCRNRLQRLESLVEPPGATMNVEPLHRDQAGVRRASIEDPPPGLDRLLGIVDDRGQLAAHEAWPRVRRVCLDRPLDRLPSREPGLARAVTAQPRRLELRCGALAVELRNLLRAVLADV